MPKPPNPLLPPDTPFHPTAAGLVRWAAKEHGDRDFVVTVERTMSYVDLEARSRAVAKQLLAAGVAKGTRVAIQFPNGADFVVAWFAVSRIGAVVVPFSTFYPPAETAKVLRLADVHLLLTPSVLLGRDQHGYLLDAVPGLADVDRRPFFLPDAPMLRDVWVLGDVWVTGDTVAPWARSVPFATDPAAEALVSDAVLEAVEAEVTPADWVTMIHTSGTTADPKGVIHTNGTIVRQGYLHSIWLAHTREQRVFSTMALFWIGGLGQWLLPTMVVGGAILFQERPDPAAAVALMASARATRLAGYGAGAIVAHPSFATADLSDALRASVGAAAMPRHGSSCGMTETAAIHSTVLWDEELPPEQRGSHGRAIPGVQLKIVDPDTWEEVPDGEIGTLLVRGHVLMAAMNKRERESVFEPDGWYDTGDRCFLRDGLLWFRGRYNEMIKTSGANVAPAEVEAALRALPEVADAAVLGVPDDERGQCVAAAVVPAPGATVDLAAVTAQLRAVLSAYKVPRRWLVVAPGTLPTLANGKPDRLQVAQILAERAAPA